MPPSTGSGSGTSSNGTPAQLMRELAEQMRQVQDTVAALAEDNAALKAKVAVLEASVERLQGQGGAAGQTEGPAPELNRRGASPDITDMQLRWCATAPNTLARVSLSSAPAAH